MANASEKQPYGHCEDDSCALYAMWALAIGFAIMRIIALFFTENELFHDEAQYIYWAQSPAFGYYSKPPMVAWMVALSQTVCGETEACARLSSPLLHGGTALFIFAIARRMFPRDVSALASGLIYLTLPGVALSSGIISVDPSLMFFWAGALYFFVRALDSPYRLRLWLACGLFSGLGMLSKYTMVLFGVGIFLYLLFTLHRRYILRLRGFWLASITGMLVFLPNILWNAANGMVSLRHTKDNAAFDTVGWSPEGFLEFFGAQFGVAGPVFFAALLAGLCCSRKHEANVCRHGGLLLWQMMPMFAVISIVALISRAHGNWAAPAYIAVCIYIARFLCTPEFRRWLIAGLVINILAGFIIMVPRPAASLLGIELGPRTNLSRAIIKDPLMRIEGGQTLGKAVKQAYHRLNSSTAYVLTTDRATHALLSYYSDIPHNRIKRLHTEGAPPKDHFQLTSPFTLAAPGNVYLLVTRNPKIHRSLSTEDLTEPETISIGRYPERQKNYYLSSFKKLHDTAPR